LSSGYLDTLYRVAVSEGKTAQMEIIFTNGIRASIIITKENRQQS
jgi:hypothetical protein